MCNNIIKIILKIGYENSFLKAINYVHSLFMEQAKTLVSDTEQGLKVSVTDKLKKNAH
jgi:hypothetical protein